MSSLRLTFRVVGVYCYYKDLTLDFAQPLNQVTVKDIMDAIVNKDGGKFNFTYDFAEVSSKKLVKKICYEFVDRASEVPPNSKFSSPGTRCITNTELEKLEYDEIGEATAAKWQFYRFKVNSDGSRVRLRTKGQPSFATTIFDADPATEAKLAADQVSYELIWRSVQIKVKPDTAKILLG
ncbi:MAG: hypothetical protein AAF135_07920 [Bacteroidota bacterium]